MSIIVNNQTIGNVLSNNKQLDKVIANGVVVWENWTGPYEEKKEDPVSSYRNVASVSWTFSTGVKLIYACAGAWNENQEQNDAKIYITTSDGKYNNTVISDSGVSDFGTSTEWSGTIENVTYIKCSSEGTVNRKGANGIIKYYKKGS